MQGKHLTLHIIFERTLKQMKKNFKRTTAALLALTLCASPLLKPESAIISKIIPIDSISASAADAVTPDGNWEFDITSSSTARIAKYTGTNKNVTVPERVQDSRTKKYYTVNCIGGGAFKYGNPINSVMMPRGITEIYNYAFADLSTLTQVILPETLTEIGDCAFYGTGITSIYLPQSVQRIGKNAFENSKLTSVTLPYNLKEIDWKAFAYTNITTISIPNNASLGWHAFEGCNNLTNINLSNYILEDVIKDGALGGAPNLKKINNEDVVKINSSTGLPYYNTKFSYYMKKYFAVNDLKNVSFANQYLDAYIKRVVATETAGCTSDLQKVRALHDWVCNNANYAFLADGKTPDPSDEASCDSSVFMRGKAVCDGYARALTLLLREAKVDAYYVKSSSHAWTMVKIGKYYFHIDACHDGETDNTIYSHYLKSDNDIKKCEFGHERWSITTPPSASRIKTTISTPKCDYSLGDVNKNKKLDSNDSDYLQKYIVDIYTSLPDKTLADVNGDGKINISDVIFLNKLINQQIQ